MLRIKPKDYNQARILSQLAGIELAEVLIHGADVDSARCEEYNRSIQMIDSGYPLDYILGEVLFGDKKFAITNKVLVPRPETEKWVSQLEKNIKERPGHYQSMTLVDLGTGSGVIGLTLSKYFHASYLLDIDPDAIEVAQQNRDTLEIDNAICQLSHGLEFMRQDENRFWNLETCGWVLVANLPYLPTSDKNLAVVRRIRFEPEIALYSGPDGLELYMEVLRELTADFDNNLPKEAWFELDPRNINQAKEIAESTFGNKLLESQILEDEAGHDRVLVLKL